MHVGLPHLRGSLTDVSVPTMIILRKWPAERRGRIPDPTHGAGHRFVHVAREDVGL